MVWIALLSYIFIVLFRDTPLAYICCTWFDGHMAINGKLDYCNTLVADFIAEKLFLDFSPLISPL